MWLTLAKFFLGNPLGRIFDTIDKKMDNETERTRIKTEAIGKYVDAQMAVLTGPGWWFPLFFIVPLGLWFASVCIYSMLFCAKCAFPQTWSIAALPPPLDEWSGLIVGSLFIGASGMKIFANWKR